MFRFALSFFCVVVLSFGFALSAEKFDEVYYQINDDIITRLDIKEALLMNEKLRKLGFPLTTNERAVVDDLVQSILIEQELHRNNVYISEVDIINQLSNVAKGNRLKSVDEFKSIIVNAGIDWDYFLKVEKAYISRQYLTRYLPLANQPTAKEIHDYYLKHKKDFFVDKAILVSEIVFRRAENATFSELSELSKKVNDVKKQIEKGADFDKLKRKYSDEDIQSEWKIKDDYDWFPEVWNILAALKKGAVTDPIDAPGGFYIVKIIDVRMNQELEYSKIQDLVSMKIMNERNKKALEEKISELKEKAFIKSDFSGAQAYTSPQTNETK